MESLHTYALKGPATSEAATSANRYAPPFIHVACHYQLARLRTRVRHRPVSYHVARVYKHLPHWFTARERDHHKRSHQYEFPH